MYCGRRAATDAGYWQRVGADKIGGQQGVGEGDEKSEGKEGGGVQLRLVSGLMKITKHVQCRDGSGNELYKRWFFEHDSNGV